jgi:hypothetical protein
MRIKAAIARAAAKIPVKKGRNKILTFIASSLDYFPKPSPSERRK